MHRPSGQDRHARRPALEQCEDRILQSTLVEPANNQATQPHQTAYTADGSRIVALYKAAPDHASAIFDDPFFFDTNYRQGRTKLRDRRPCRGPAPSGNPAARWPDRWRDR
jgi:hypothetical protein